MKILTERSWEILYKKPPTTAKTILDPGEESLNEPKIKAPKNINIAHTEMGKIIFYSKLYLDGP